MPETQLGVQEKRPDLPTPVAPAWDSGLEAIEGSPGGSAGKESTCYAEDLGLIPGSERSPGEGNGNPLQSSCLEISMDRGTWWATVHRITESDISKRLTFTSRKEVLLYEWCLGNQGDG